MDAVEFLKIYKRMCENNSRFLQIDLSRADFESMVGDTEQWAKEHPIKTRQSEFLKMFPNALVAEVGSYRAGKEEGGGGFVVTVYDIYPTAYAVSHSIDIAELKDFRLICETKVRRIRYQISSWSDEYYPIEENGAITSRRAFHCARTEDVFD